MTDIDDGLPGISDSVIRSLQTKGQELTSARKQRSKNIPEDLATVDEIHNYTETAHHDGIHSASIPGITALDLNVSFKFIIFF